MRDFDGGGGGVSFNINPCIPHSEQHTCGSYYTTQEEITPPRRRGVPVLQISSDRDIRGIFWDRKIWQDFLGVGALI